MSRRGFTLVETMLAIVIVAVVTGIAIPRMRSTWAKASLRGSRNALTVLYAQARVTAMQRGRDAGLRFDGNRAFVTAWPRLDGLAGYDTVGLVRDLSAEFGVTLAPLATNPITINAKGFALEATTITATKGGYADSVQISRYGRLTK